jgi:hypothetical protein
MERNALEYTTRHYGQVPSNFVRVGNQLQDLANLVSVDWLDARGFLSNYLSLNDSQTMSSTTVGR